MGSLWLSLSSGTIPPGIPLGPEHAWPWEHAASQGAAPRGETLDQEVPMAEGSAPQAVGSRGECVAHAGCCQRHTGFAGPLACPPAPCRCAGQELPTRTHSPADGRGFSHQGWLLSRSSQRFKLSGCRSLGTASQNIPKYIPDGDEDWDETEQTLGRDEGFGAVWGQQDLHSQLSVAVWGGGYKLPCSTAARTAVIWESCWWGRPPMCCCRPWNSCRALFFSLEQGRPGRQQGRGFMGQMWGRSMG